MSFFDNIREYLDKKESLTCIPVSKKMPVVSDWPNIKVDHDVIDSWEDSGVYCDGFGLRAGQHNIGFVDIDTDDAGLIHIFNEIIDLPPVCSKVGKKGRTIFFRFIGEPPKPKYNIYLRKGDKKPIFEFFFASGQTVMPPSIHPETMLPYRWESESLLDIDLEDLPTIDMSKLEHFETVIQAGSMELGLKLVPTSVTGDGSGKYHFITKMATKLIHQGFDDASIAKTLVFHDRKNFAISQFFFSNKIGKDLVSKTDDLQNALLWIGSYKQSILRSDAKLRESLSRSAKITDHVPEYNDWEPPRPILNKKTALEFPDYLFPKALESYCKDHASLAALPPEAYLMGLFTTLSAVAQAKFLLKAKSDFSIHPSLALLLSAPSGSRKDAIYNASMAPLKKMIKRDYDNLDSDFVEREKDIIIKLTDLSKKKIKAISESDDTLKEELNKEIIKYQGELIKHKIRRPNFIFEAGTQEKLFEIMESNQHRGMLIAASEYITIMGGMGKKGNENLRSFYLKALNSSPDESFLYQTKAGTNVNIKKCLAAAIMGIQTDILANELKENEAGRNNDGLLQRFFIVNIDPEIRMMGDDDKPIDTSRVDNLFALIYDMDGMMELTWENEETKRLFYSYELELKTKIQHQKSAIKSFRSKYVGSVVKLAFLYELCNSGVGRIPKSISKASLLLAIELLEWLSLHLDISFSASKYASAVRSAESILSAMRAGGVDIRNFQKSVISITRLSHGDFIYGVDLLIEHGYLRRDGNSYEINPHF